MNENNTVNSSALRMGTEAILPLIIKMSLPSMFSMLIQALYNIVDSIFVSRVSEAALSAVSLIYPIQLLNVAVGVGTGIGLASLVSRKLGEGNEKEAQAAADHGILIALWSWAIFALIGLFAVGPFVRAFSKTPELVADAISYGRIVCIGCVFIFSATNGERIMQGCSNMIAPMLCALAGCITNIILDPIMIFGYFGMPALGVAGAAYATVIGQFVTFLATMFFMNKSKTMPIKMRLKICKPKRITLKQIYSVAFPSMIMQSIASVTTVVMNAILISFSETAVAVLGVYFKLQSFVFMPVFGMNQGTMPIMGYNYGARNRKRLIKTLTTACLLAVGIMGTGCLLFQLFPEILMGFFNAEGEMLRLGVHALKVISICFPFAALSIIPGALFQATGHGFNSLITSILRQLVLIIPLAFIFSKIFGLDGVWYAYPAAELGGLLTTWFLFIKLYRNDISKF